MAKRPVVTLTLNPALDLTIQLDALTVGELNLANNGSLRAAGKGINVARVLRDLDESVYVTGILGQSNRELFDALFSHHNMENHYLYEQGATRTNVKISESSNPTTDINLPGLYISDAIWQRLKHTLLVLCDRADWFVLSGSLPRGLAADSYGKLCSVLHSQDKKVIIDTSGEALQAAVTAAPHVIKPNILELAQWAGKPLDKLQDKHDAVRLLLNKGIKHVVLSDGENGLSWYTQDAAWQATPPNMDVVSTVGAGDSLVAGITHGLMNQHSITDTLISATAIAAMAVSQIGVGIPCSHQLDSLKQQVIIQPLPFKEHS